jgi:glutathione S-transferase
MKLYHFKPARSTRVAWLVEELGVPCEIVPVDLNKGEQRAPEYRKIHPHGWVPALVEGEQTIIESAAIVLQLADRFADRKLAPAVGSPARAKYYQWSVYGPATIDPLLETVTQNTVLLPPAERNPAAAKAAAERFRTCGEVLSAAIGNGPYLLGAEFSAADVIIGYDCFWASFVKLLADTPKLAGYLDRLSQRPAFRKAFA